MGASSKRAVAVVAGVNLALKLVAFSMRDGAITLEVGVV